MPESNDPVEGLRQLMDRIGSDSLPDYLLQFVLRVMPKGRESIALHPSMTIENMKDADKKKIERAKGLFGQVTRDYSNAVHHFKIFFNNDGMARVIYKNTESITFIKNIKNA